QARQQRPVLQSALKPSFFSQKHLLCHCLYYTTFRLTTTLLLYILRFLCCMSKFRPALNLSSFEYSNVMRMRRVFQLERSNVSSTVCQVVEPEAPGGFLEIGVSTPYGSEIVTLDSIM